MKQIVQFIFTISATFWLCVVFLVKNIFENKDFRYYENYKVLGLVIFVPIALSVFSILLSKLFSNDEIGNVKSFALADNEFLPVYLGYFFVALSINSFEVMGFIYALLVIFTYLSKSHYFNPLFILFGFHFYSVETIGGSSIFVIKKGKVSKTNSEIENLKLKRINDNCFISF